MIIGHCYSNKFNHGHTQFDYIIFLGSFYLLASYIIFDAFITVIGSQQKLSRKIFQLFCCIIYSPMPITTQILT